MSFNQSLRFLDSDAERRQLVDDIRQIRRAVISMRETIPEEKWYEPRYHGWSLAAMLGHLQTMDNLNLLLIQAALVGINPSIPMDLVNFFNDHLARVFQKRVMATTIRGIEKNEHTLESFIMRLPIDKFSKQVFYPPQNRYLTIEQALQVMFLHHWQDHLQTMLTVEGIQPRDTSN